MYEITFITIEEESATIIKEMLDKIKVKIDFDYPMGRKNFAYPIQKENTGYYYTYFFNANPSQIEKFNNDLRMERKILRYLLVKNNENIDVIKDRVAKIKNENKKPKTLEKTSYKPIIKEPFAQITKQAVVQKDKEIEIEEPVKKITPEKTEKKAEKSVKKVSKKIVKEKATPKKKVTTDDEIKAKNEEERIKKLEEKLDELLNE